MPQLKRSAFPSSGQLTSCATTWLGLISPWRQTTTPWNGWSLLEPVMPIPKGWNAGPWNLGHITSQLCTGAERPINSLMPSPEDQWHWWLCSPPPGSSQHCPGSKGRPCVSWHLSPPKTRVKPPSNVTSQLSKSVSTWVNGIM